MADDLMPPPMGEPPTPDPLAMEPVSNPDVFMPLDKEKRGKWRKQITESRAQNQQMVPWWEAALTAYGPKPGDPCKPGEMRARTQVIAKIVGILEASLFHKRGDLSVAPSPLLKGQEQLCKIHADIINEKMGPDGVDSVGVMQQAIFDYLLFGCGWSVMGYEVFTRPAMNPQTMQMEDVPLAKRCFWVPLSPKEALTPANLKSPDLDRHSAWAGYDFSMTLADARRLWKDKIPKDFKGSGTRTDQQHFQFGSIKNDAPEDDVRGSMLWYRSNLHREDIATPEHFTKLVFVDGIDEEVEHRNDPDQTLTPEGGLTPDSRPGYPIQSLYIRRMTDSARIMSDVAMALPLSTELDIYRENQLLLRQTQLVRFAIDATKMPKEGLAGLMQNVMGGMIQFPPEVMADFDRAFRQIDPGTYAQDNYRGEAAIRSDIEELFGLDANAAGVTSSGSGTTATESNHAAAGRGVRTSYAQAKVSDFYTKAVTKYSTLIQRYFDQTDVAPIVGHDNAAIWEKFAKLIPTRLAFQLQPDSTLYNDTAVSAKQARDNYSQLANDPNIDRAGLLKQLLPLLHLDPTIVTQPPPAQPEKPKASLALKLEGLDPRLPSSPYEKHAIETETQMKFPPEVVAEAYRLAGIAQEQLVMQEMADTAQSGNAPQQEHPGAVQPVETLDKHQFDITGGMNATGSPTAGLSPNTGQPAGQPM